MFRTSAVLTGFLILTSLATRAPGQLACTTNYYRFEEGAANAAATGSLIDSVNIVFSGTPIGGPVYRADVLTPVVPNTGAPNALALEFGGTQSALFPSLFIFHQGYAAATLEFFIKVPDQWHQSIFWTRAGDTDANRYNITVNANGGFGFDYRSPTGVLHIPSASENIFSMALDAWHHIAVVRSGITYSFYLDGVFQASRSDPLPHLPTSIQWSIAGRSGYEMIGLIDEIRFSACALAPNQFLIAPCYPDCNTDGSLTVADFGCFQTKFVAADPYADCNADGSQTVADFGCFQTKFVAGCP